MVKVGIVGGTGYAGVELIRILCSHPLANIETIISRHTAGSRVSDIFPSLRGCAEMVFSGPEDQSLFECDVVFFATPHGVAMEQAEQLLERDIRIVDLAADFRLKNIKDWNKWYTIEHSAVDLLEEAVYGLPELYRDEIKNARLVGNPGCYATAVELGFKPLLSTDLIDPANLVADAKSGVSGAGRKSELGIIYSEVGDNFKAYGVSGHRHHPEIVQVLENISEKSISLRFVPHLLPINRGIIATLYAKRTGSSDDVIKAFQEAYSDEPFVDLLPQGHFPDTRSVRGTNLCQIGLEVGDGDDTVVVISAIDNLVKGAAGQAIQNMNIMFGIDETAGLNRIGMIP